jgi:glucose-1-phosphate thymidylyltransferase
MVLNGLITPGLTVAQVGASVGAPPGDPFGAGLQRVANRPIVCHALDRLRDAGVRDVALLVPGEIGLEMQACLSAEGPTEVSTRCFPYEHDAYRAALAEATDFLGDAPCIVYPPNGLLMKPLEGFSELLSTDAPDLVVFVHEGPGEIDSIGLASRRLLRLAQNCTTTGTGLGLSGVCIFGVGVLRRAEQIGWPPAHESGIVAVAETLVKDGGLLHIGYVDGWLTYTGRAAELLGMNRVALDELETQADQISGALNRIEGPVSVHPSACVQSSVIIGPAIIGAGALVVESYIGPYTSIGAHAHIEGAEVERSIILAGASIMHVGGRLVASVVGRDARVARDFSLPRAMRLNVGDGGEVVLC